MKTVESKGNWTRLWRSQKVDLGREEKWTERDIYSKDSRRLKHLGVSAEKIEKVKNEFAKYHAGHVQFHRFVFLFARDTETVRRWTKSTNISTAFLRFCHRITKNKREAVKSKLSELLLLIELFRKREITQYEAQLHGALELSTLSIRSMLSTLKLGERTAGFKIEKKLNYDKFTVYSLSKKSGANQKVYKFILLRKIRNKLLIHLALDTTEERNKILGKLSKKFRIPINRLKEKPNLRGFINFLKNGRSESFTLIGVDFVDQAFRISILPQYGRPESITNNTYYKQILTGTDVEILESIQKIKIAHLTQARSMPVNVYFLNYKNEDIVGGMKLSLNAKGLNLSKRESLKADYKKDFGFSLDTPLIFEVNEKEIYKKFLYNPTKKKKRIEIISDKAIEISHKLLKYGLLPQPKQIEETAKICTYHGCPIKYKPQWVTNKICTCGNDLWDRGSTLITQLIDEKRVRDFFYKIALENNYQATVLEKDLIKRKIFPLEVEKNDEKVCFIPITIPLTDQQLDVLQYRFPNLIFVTSRNDSQTLSAKGFQVQELYSFTHELFTNPTTKIDNLLDSVTANKLTKLRDLSNNSSGRVTNDTWYINQGTMSAEFFEADISMLLNYIFKNSIWLGAKRRGEPLPDSLSAFPIEDRNRGCFISDAKFSLGAAPNIGKRDKNKKYITIGKNNSSITDNGGLKGFVFIGNKPAPSNFISKISKVIGRKAIKVGYLKNSHILQIYSHLKHWENEMEMDRRKRDIFLNSMELIFLTTASLRRIDKIIIWTDEEINTILDNNITAYRALGSPALQV